MNADRPLDDMAGPAERNEPGRPRIVPVEALLAGDREVVLVHNGERYRLRVTQNGKLILTK